MYLWKRRVIFASLYEILTFVLLESVTERIAGKRVALYKLLKTYFTYKKIRNKK